MAESGVASTPTSPDLAPVIRSAKKAGRAVRELTQNLAQLQAQLDDLGIALDVEDTDEQNEVQQ
jgi:hypothetical protein